MGEITSSPEKPIDFKAPVSKPKVIEVSKSPTSGASLIKKEDGLYYDEYTGTSFEVNKDVFGRLCAREIASLVFLNKLVVLVIL